MKLLPNLLRLFVPTLRQSFKGSLLGTSWLFIRPIFLFSFFYLFFYQGLGLFKKDYFFHILSGFIIWSYLSQNLLDGPTILLRRAQTVKFSNFNFLLFPYLVALINAIPLLVYLTLGLGCYIFVSGKILLTWLQFLLFFPLVYVFVVGLNLTFSTIAIFFRDWVHGISLVEQLMFWSLPIYWMEEQASPQVLYLSKMNPCYFIVQAGRFIWLEPIWFWQRLEIFLPFAGICLSSFFIGRWLSEKLRYSLVEVIA